jgi:hypothetical protein
MVLAEPNMISRRRARSINAGFLDMGYISVGQADGPYPGMYEHWPSRHLHESSGLPGQLEQMYFPEEITRWRELKSQSAPQIKTS